jgi:hypothetical protein
MYGTILFLTAMLSSLGVTDSLAVAEQPTTTAAGNHESFNSPAAVPGRHHLSAGLLGYYKSISGDFVSDQDNFNASNGQCGFFNYRYSLDRRLDLAIDARGWTDNSQLYGDQITVIVAAAGPGLRCSFRPAARRFHFYVQANGYLVSETINGNYIYDTTSVTSNDIGFGLNAGAEMRLNDRFSIPAEVSFLWGRPQQDITGFGIAVGISFNWGRVE